MTTQSLSIDIAVNAPIWAELGFAQDEAWWQAQLSPLLGLEGVALENMRLGELSVMLIDDAQMAVLNKDYRAKEGPTNVLSFPALDLPDENLPDCAPLLGDIVLSHGVIAREAHEKGVSFEAHLSHLAIHGFLHLQGHDHQSAEQAAKMEAIEITALATLGIDNPYESKTLD